MRTDELARNIVLLSIAGTSGQYNEFNLRRLWSGSDASFLGTGLACSRSHMGSSASALTFTGGTVPPGGVLCLDKCEAAQQACAFDRWAASSLSLDKLSNHTIVRLPAHLELALTFAKLPNSNVDSAFHVFFKFFVLEKKKH